LNSLPARLHQIIIRLRSDLYCVEWDTVARVWRYKNLIITIKLYYTIPYHTSIRSDLP